MLPIASHRRQGSQPHSSPLHTHTSTAQFFHPPQNPYHIPHQGAPRTLGLAHTGPSTQLAFVPPVTRRRSTVGHQRKLSNEHPHLHTVYSPSIAFSRLVGSPIPENMHHLAYIPPPMTTSLPPYAAVYPYRNDLVITPAHIFPPTASAPTLPIYPHTLTNTSPPPNPLLTVRHTSGSAHNPTPHAMHSPYTPMGYTTPPSYAYPSPPSFVPIPSIYGLQRPPHHSRPYGFPAGRGSQGQDFQLVDQQGSYSDSWSYSTPGATAASPSFEGTQRESQPRLTTGYPPVGQLDSEQPGQRDSAALPSEPQPTRRPSQIRIGGSLNENAQQEATLATSPSSPTSLRARRSCHPNPPADRSDWVMWIGNVPSDVTQDELREFFDQPLPPVSPSQTEPPKDKQKVYGGVSTVFLISRSNCAFVNFESEAQLDAATVRFNNKPIRPDDHRCPRLVCRVRRREDDFLAGVGSQRGSGMHVKWVKEQKDKIQREQAVTVGSPKDMPSQSSPLSVSVDDDGWIGEGQAFTHSNLSNPASIASTNSDILTRYFPQRYFILKSLTQVCIPPLLNPRPSHSHFCRAIWT